MDNGTVTSDRFSVITDGLPSQLPDLDPEETREWLESLDSVINVAGRGRARYLMLKLLERAREHQVGVPALRSTDYINTIPPEREPWFPGDEYIERRIRAYIRWNAAVMVSRANRPELGVGGHIATYASMASLYEVGFNHFFRGKDHGQPDRAQGLGFVHLAVAEERPHVRPRGVVELTGQQVPVEPGLVDRVQRAEPHRHRGELPEIGHQPRVRVGRQPAARVRQFLPETVELILGQPALEERAGVDARRRVTLEEHLVAGFAVVLAAEEVVEADLVERSRAGVGGDVPADAQAGPVRAGDHHGRVPPDIGPDPAFGMLVTGEPRLALRRDRVDEVGAAQAGHPDLLLARPLEQAEHHVPGAGPASGTHDRIERLDPFARLVRVDVGQLGRQPVADDRELLTSGSHGVASPSAVSRAAGRPRERIPRCVVQTNRRTNWPSAHLYLTVTGPSEGFAPKYPPKPGMLMVSPYANPPRPRDSGSFAEGGSVVTLRDESCGA